jgi:hypothetical protein
MTWLLLLALADQGPQPDYVAHLAYKSEALCEAAGEEIKARAMADRGWKIVYLCVDSGSPPVWPRPIKPRFE